MTKTNRFQILFTLLMLIKINGESISTDEDDLTIIINNSNDTSVTSPSFMETGLNKSRQLEQQQQQQQQQQQFITQFIKSQIKKEVRKLKSSITDSIMEEVINYFGKKLEMNEQLKLDIESLNKKFSSLTQNLNTLGQNYKSISKNHRNLVDVVRNNIINTRKEKEMERSKSQANNTRWSKNGSANTRAVSSSNESNPKKKSVERNSLLNTILMPIDKTTTTIVLPTTHITETNENKLKLELINDLETKYLHLIDDKLTNVILKNLVNDTRKLVIRHDVNDKKITSNDHEQDDDDESLHDYQKLPENSEILSADCQDILDRNIDNGRKSIDGAYKMKFNLKNHTFDGYCEFENGIGWTLLQNRFDGSVNFYQNWKAYKNGFGNVAENSEFWLGLDNMHDLTSQNDYSLQIVLTDWKDNKYLAEYEHFKVDDEKSKYKLELTNFLKNSSNAGDSLGDSLNPAQSHNNMSFSTFDSDNDLRFYDNCAQIFKSGWWFNACFQSNLNGIYYHYSSSNDNPNPNLNRLRSAKQEENSQLRFLRNGIHWNSIDFYKSLKSTKLRIRRRNIVS